MYRIVTENRAGESRTIEYTSRQAAFKHFSTLALNPQIFEAVMNKQPHPDAPWEEVACMTIRRHPEPQQEANA